MAVIRTVLEDETCLEIILHPKEGDRFLFRAGLDYEGTFSSKSSGRTAIRSGVEYLGKDGFSLLLKTSIMDELSVGLSLFQPLGPRFFLSAETDLVRDQEIVIEGILKEEETTPRRLLYFASALKGGWRFNRRNSLILWPESFWFKEEDISYTEAGFATAYTFNSLNNAIFPSRGFRFRLDNRLRFVPESAAGEIFDLVSADLSAVVPLGQRFSLGLSGFGSMLFGEPELTTAISAFGTENPGRIYFPHDSGVFSGEKKAALSLALQFEPLGNLSILGGRLIFFIAASAGSLFEWNTWDNFNKDSILWNASVGTALIPFDTIGLLVRAGAGGGNGSRPVPFVSLDVGMRKFQKGLF
jgi:hypothetical protein